ncbi:hypothetical protein CW705_08935 [Candidatus Bathyarchaeota archaeon]|nr:MAG: hypothetical protein CW705_08935 [Candidatus Bathyarchaeota archaeon]
MDEFCDADSLALSEGLELGVKRLRHDYVGVSKLRHLGFFLLPVLFCGVFSYGRLRPPSQAGRPFLPASAGPWPLVMPSPEGQASECSGHQK